MAFLYQLVINYEPAKWLCQKLRSIDGDWCLGSDRNNLGGDSVSLLTLIGALPLLGAGLIYFLPSKNSDLIKKYVFVITTLVAIGSIFLALGFDKSVTSMQYVQSNSWISAFNINFAVGVDGISLVLILLSTILVPIVILATWNESEGGRWGVKTFYVLILILDDDDWRFCFY